jgi:hypothetical protein
MPSAHRRRLGIAATALASLAVLAGGGTAQAASCTPDDTSKPFLPWVDVANYVLAPGGDLEAEGAWSLAGGAAVVDGNEPFQVGGEEHASSLRVPAGGSAETAPMCVGLEHPTLRFFAKRESSSWLGALRVDAVFSDEDGREHVWPMAGVMGSSGWAPSAPLPIVINTLAVTGSTIRVSFRFTPLNGSQWRIDDVYVDPYRTN